MSFSEKFGTQYMMPKGYVVEPKASLKYKHRFGGSSWSIVDDSVVGTGPTLLFVLDLVDPKLSDLIKPSSLDELPICSYINSDISMYEQIYKVNGETKEVLLIDKHVSNNSFHNEDGFSIPLPERAIDLRDMVDSEYPVTEQLYWDNTDEFLGGQSFIRVMGSPLWIQEPVNMQCSCNSKMSFVMGIGYEAWNGPYQYFDREPFFLGESALYFFYCNKCHLLKVISQPT